MSVTKVTDDLRDTTALDGTKVSGTIPVGSLFASGGKGADIASAATVVIGTDGSYFDITGTTGISTQFTVAAGRRFTLQFDGAVTITDNAAITLSGAANFTTAAGDILSFVAVAANTVVQTGYSLVDGGSPVAAAGGEDGLTNSSNTTWMTVSADEEVNLPLQPSFRARRTTSMENVTGTNALYVVDIIFTTEDWDIGGNYDTSTGVFTAPITGKYYLCFGGIYLTGFSGNNTGATAQIFTSNRMHRTHASANWDNNYSFTPNSGGAVCDMEAGDTAKVMAGASGNSSGQTVDVYGDGSYTSNGYCWFAGWLLG